MNPVPLTTLPGQVEDLRQRDFSPNDASTTFDWVPPDPSITRYNVWWWTDGQDLHTDRCSIPSFTLYNLKAGCQYSLQVACILCVHGDEHRGVWSDVKKFETAPIPPRQLTVSPALQSPSTSFLVKYVDEDPIGKKYAVKVTSLLSGEEKLNETEHLFALIDGLSPGTPYSVSVTSIKNGAASKPCKLEREKPTVPGKVMELGGIRSSATSQTISWGKVFGAETYRVKWKKVDGNLQTISTKETQITLSHLASGKKYEVHVAAENSSGIGEYSDPRQFSTDLASPHNLMTAIKYSGENAWAEVDFTAAEDQETKMYIVKLTPGLNGDENEETPARVQQVSTTHVVFTQLDHGTCYVPSVVAVGESGVESQKMCGIPVWTRPGPVKGLRTKTVSGNAERIKWEEANGGLSYIVLIQEEGEEPKPQREITENQITLNNLSLNTTYAVSVASKNDGGVGKFSAPVNFQTAVAAPTNVVVKNHPDKPEHGVIATWQECDGATQYIADLIDDTTKKKVVSWVQKDCRKEFLGEKVEAGHQYKVALQSIGTDIKRNSEIVYSESIWTYCSQVQNLEVRLVSPSTVDITWDRAKEAEKYRIICKARSGKMFKEESQTHHFTMTKLDLGETYDLSVAPWNKAGYGKESDAMFRTGLAPPANVKFTFNQGCAKIQFTEPQKKPPAYCISVSELATEQVVQSKVIKQNCYILPNVRPGVEHVAYVWSTDPDAPNLDSEKTAPLYFATAPPQVEGIQVIKDSPTSRNVTWEAVLGASRYIAKLKKAGCPPIMKDVAEECECHFDKLDLHAKYTLSITAQNDGGKSRESAKINFETELHPPKGVRVTNDKVNPTTDLNIKVEEPDVPASGYRVRIMRLNGEPDDFVTITRQEAMSVKKLGGLTPGDSYQLAICSLHDEDEKLNSKEILSDVIQTKTPPLTFELLKISNNKQKVTWSVIIGATGYTLYSRTQFGEWVKKQFQPDETETVLKDLKSGEIYEIKVAAINESGSGQESHVKKFTTGPSTPVELKSEPISTRAMKFSCQKSHGTSEYIFDINGEQHKRMEPVFLLSHAEDIKNFDFKVSASNDGGCSYPSPTSHCSQTLLKLQQKFLKKAKNYNSKFITPLLSEVPSGNPAPDFGAGNFRVGIGNTVCLQGTKFSGKTSCAFHYLQNLPEDLLPIFLDWDDYKEGKSKKTDVKSVLAQQMKDFEEYEKEFAFQWMKSHPDKVVFVVDDLVLPQNVVRKIKLYDDVAFVEEIFYSLVTTDREIFTQSQVLCSTSQSDLRQIIKPNRTLKIDGFEESQISKMKEMELCEEKDVMLPKHLAYFCKNPCYCKLILQFMKNKGPNMDIQSYSSVMIQIISESVSRYPDEKRNEKLHDLLKDIQDIPRKLKTAKIDPTKLPKKSKSTSSTAGVTQAALSQISDVPTFSEFQTHAPAKHCCETLHDYMTKALYFGLLCPLEEFRKRFQKKSIKLGANSTIWILAAGLLRQHTTNLAADLFGAIDYQLNMKEMDKKLEFTKKFIRDNRDLIHKQMSSDSQISLDWLDIINEIEAFDIIPKSDWKVSVKHTHKTEEIEQMANFLRHVRGIFFSHIRVKLEKDLPPEIRLPIDTAMKNNPDGEICANSSGSISHFSRNALNLSFRSKGRRPSVKPDLHSTLSSVEDEANDSVFPENSVTSDDQTFHSQEEEPLSAKNTGELNAASTEAGHKESGPI